MFDFVTSFSGHEIYGFDNIPNQGPAIIVYYHGAIPVDFYYVLARVIVEKKRPIYAIGDRFLYKIPGIYAKNWKVY